MNARVPTLGPREIALRRLANQHLIGAPFATPVDVVQRLGAVQSQDYDGGKWGIAQRTSGATNAVVERALNDGAILRTHVLRPTWHFVAAGDIRWMLSLTAPRVRKTMASYDSKLGLDDKVFGRSAEVIAVALAGGKQLTRTELGEALRAARVYTGGSQKLAHLMMRAELDGLVCSGVRRGKQATYALLEDRVPAAPPMQRDQALAELATRYFTTRGPATVHDFGWWSGLTIGDARKGVQAVESQLEQRSVDGRTYWFTGEAAPAKAAADDAHLLPNYDEYFIGLKDRSAIGELVKTSTVEIPSNTFTAHVVVVNGQLVGGWRRIAGPSTTVLRVRLVVKVTKRQTRSIEAQAARFGEFLELPVELDSAPSTSPESLQPPVGVGQGMETYDDK